MSAKHVDVISLFVGACLRGKVYDTTTGIHRVCVVIKTIIESAWNFLREHSSKAIKTPRQLFGNTLRNGAFDLYLIRSCSACMKAFNDTRLPRVVGSRTRRNERKRVWQIGEQKNFSKIYRNGCIISGHQGSCGPKKNLGRALCPKFSVHAVKGPAGGYIPS